MTVAPTTRHKSPLTPSVIVIGINITTLNIHFNPSSFTAQNNFPTATPQHPTSPETRELPAATILTMAASDDLINFDIIEAQKENIQALPSGRSAKKLAELFSPSPLHKLDTPTPSDTQNVNDCIRAEYEAEIENISESDDPLDIFDRYVRWTLDAYPSAQATPASQLHTILERATKAFVNSAQYKNDPRYLKLWVLYIQFFSDSPRETFLFLSRHNIGETLALFYEEYAAWLEGAGRWNQAEEVYKLGIEREARPVQRLMRKFKEFEERLAQQPEEAVRPSSPALPTMRPALAAKIDPFAAARAAAADPQAPRPNQGVGGPASKPGKAKMAIFSDADAAPPALSARESGSKGWDSIGSLADRKKENVMEPKPWAGETLKAGGKKSTAPKMAIFRDTVCPTFTFTSQCPDVDDYRTNGWLWRFLYFSLSCSRERNLNHDHNHEHRCQSLISLLCLPRIR